MLCVRSPGRCRSLWEILKVSDNKVTHHSHQSRVPHGLNGDVSFTREGTIEVTQWASMLQDSPRFPNIPLSDLYAEPPGGPGPRPPLFSPTHPPPPDRRTPHRPRDCRDKEAQGNPCGPSSGPLPTLGERRTTQVWSGVENCGPNVETRGRLGTGARGERARARERAARPWLVGSPGL